MNNEIKQIVNDFNNILLDLAKNIASVCPDSIIGRNIRDIEKTFRKSEYQNKFIDVFVGRVLQYKSEIDNWNEEFFLKEKSYDQDFKGYESWAGKVFEFKSIWHKLKRENKDLVIQYMQILCQLAQNYFLKLDVTSY